ncbi:MAG: M48 family metallopeptidase [Promicromonosporaceae bacterium]|nr:M48 family metallopeptidase [Promicromonosporaceae bacterium]
MDSVEVRRSARRKRTVSAFFDGGTLVVAIPAHFTRREETEWVEKMVAQVEGRRRRRRRSDSELMERCLWLSTQYLDGLVQPNTVAWVENQNRRWGSCTLVDKAIRISTRVQVMPEYVQDYVLLHELAHLLHANHSRDFWNLLARYPQAERARGFLEGFDFKSHQPAPTPS